MEEGSSEFKIRKCKPIGKTALRKPRSGVAKLLDSPSHFLEFKIFREPQLNTYLKALQKIY